MIQCDSEVQLAATPSDVGKLYVLPAKLGSYLESIKKQYSPHRENE